MVTRLLLLLQLARELAAQCAQGCLRCNAANQCLLCDVTSKYVLSNGACVASTQTNCNWLSNNGNCLVCNSGYFVDSSTFKCVQASSTVGNCELYSSATTCLQCKKGTFFNSTTSNCTTVNSAIANCDYYLTATTCAVCATNYFPNPAGTACLSSSSGTCALFSPVRCANCTAGFFLNPNFYFKSIVSDNPAIKDLFLDALSTPSLPGSGSLAVCEPSMVSNCLTQSSATACQSCLPGFYLDANSKNCVAFPISRISNCVNYTAANVCNNCTNNFYLSNGVCVAVVTIPNCISYDGTAASTICTACISTYYVSSNSCLNRTKTINNCAQYNWNADSCATCNSGFVISNDGLACLPSIANCVSYSFSTGASGSLVASCNQCAATYRLTSSSTSSATGACVLGQVNNCLQYQQSDNPSNCLQCSNTCYLQTSSNTCPQHLTIPGCLAYHSTLPQRCVTCAASSVLFTFLNACAPVFANITNCALFSNPSTCQVCNTGFFLSNNACTAITIANCVNATSSTNCISCAPGFYLILGLCYKQQALTTFLCQQVSITTPAGTNQLTQTVGCLGCTQNAMQFSLRGTMCQDQTIFFRNPTTGPKPIANCLAYAANGNCLFCSTGNYVGTDSVSCVAATACPNGKVQLNFQVPDNASGVYEVGGRNLCFTGTNMNCDTYGNSVTDGSQLCAFCKNGFFNVIDSDSAAFNYRGPNTTDASILPTSRYPSITKCTATTPGTTAANCGYYYEDGANTFFCTRCPWGTTGIAATSTNTTKRGHYASCATTVTNCDTTFFAEGLDANAYTTYTCHKCTSGVPTANIYFLNSLMYPRPGMATTVCSATTPIANCFLHTNEYASASAPTATFKCYMCNAGYVPAANGLSCVAINNCQTGTGSGWPNACATCVTTYALPFQSGVVSYSTCTQSTSKASNCLILNVAANGSVTGCLICLPNYTINYDGVCETIRTAQCTNQIISHVPAVANTAISAVAFQTFTDIGFNSCSQCVSGFVPVFGSVITCASSTYIGSLPAGTAYPLNCNLFSWNSTPLCFRCNTGYVISSDGKLCTISTQSNMGNCLTSDAAGLNCITCNSGYTLINNACILNNIAQCASYQASGSAVTCLSCNSGFALVSNTCQQGTVPNCLNYTTDAGKCAVCNANYQLLVRSDTSTYCYPLTSWLNCTLFNTNQFGSNQLSCLTCPTGFALTTTTNFTHACINFIPIPNCAVYSTSSLTAAGSLLCTLCNPAFYLTATGCTASTPVANCAFYKTASDGCLVCNSGFFLNTTGTCVSFPTGVPNCVSYSSATTCIQCSTNFYLSGGSCLAVNTTAQIANCANYGSSATTCTACNPGFYLSSNACVQGTISNCAVYNSASVCAACESNYYLSSNACAALPDPTCLQVSGGNCVSCPTGRFPSGLQCSIPSSPIGNCIAYDTATTCTRCSPGYYLVLNRTLCLNDLWSYFDSNCINNQLLSSPGCSMCNPGYYISGGACVACPANGMCGQCDPVNTSACLVCQTSAYMSADGSCVPLNPVTNNTDCATFKNCTFEWIFSLLLVLSFAALL